MFPALSSALTLRRFDRTLRRSSSVSPDSSKRPRLLRLGRRPASVMMFVAVGGRFVFVLFSLLRVSALAPRDAICDSAGARLARIL